MDIDYKAIAGHLAPVIRGQIDAATAPLVARIKELESREPIAGPKGDPGPEGASGAKGLDGTSLANAHIDRTGNLVLTLSDGSQKDLGLVVGRSVTAEEVGAIVTSAVSKAVADLPPAKDGVDGKAGSMGPVGPQGPAGERGEPGAMGPLGPAGADGKDGLSGVDGKGGADGAAGPQGPQGPAGEKGEPGQPGEVGPIGPAGPEGPVGASGAIGAAGIQGIAGKDGRDGLDVKDLLVVEDGSLVATFSDGRSKNLGRFRGVDGAPGRDGKDIEIETVKSLVKDAVAAIPVPKDGQDGVGFDDLEFAESEAGFVLRFVRGDVVKEARLPIVRDCGVYQLGRTYNKGDGISFGGSFWIAQKDGVTEKPEGGDGWRLAVKRGRDRTDSVKT